VIIKMKRQISIFLHFFILLALSACGLTKASPADCSRPFLLAPLASCAIDVCRSVTNVVLP